MEKKERIEIEILLNIHREYELLKSKSKDSLILQWFKSHNITDPIRSNETFRQNIMFIGSENNPNNTGFAIILYPGETFGKKVFIGQMKKGLRHGRGWRINNKEIFIGKYHKNTKHGKAEIYNYEKEKKVLVFRGFFYKDEPHGRCYIVKKNEYTFDGDVSYGLYDGPCEIVYENGDLFKGTMTKGSINGHGKIIYANGDIFEGNLKDNVRTGDGSYVYAQKDVMNQDSIDLLAAKPNPEFFNTLEASAKKLTQNGENRKSEGDIITHSGLYKDWNYSTKRPESEIN